MPCGQRTSAIDFIAMMVVAMYLALVVSATHCRLIGKMNAFTRILKVLLLEIFGWLRLSTRQRMIHDGISFLQFLHDTSRVLHFEFIY